MEDERFRRWAMGKVFNSLPDPVILRREDWTTLVDHLKALGSKAPHYPLFVRVGGFGEELFWD
ncbi:MAG: hypothetical protein P3W93_009330, partial [Thermus sp.]|nr:hypothetical protein [Thermus sp.]